MRRSLLFQSRKLKAPQRELCAVQVKTAAEFSVPMLKSENRIQPFEVTEKR